MLRMMWESELEEQNRKSLMVASPEYLVYMCEINTDKLTNMANV